MRFEYFIELLLTLALYSIVTYKGKKMKKMLNASKFSRAEVSVAQLCSLAYFLNFVICLFATLHKYHGTSEVVLFIKDYTAAFGICAILIECATAITIKIMKLDPQKVLYAAAKFLNAHPTTVNMFRSLSLIALLISCILGMVV